MVAVAFTRSARRWMAASPRRVSTYQRARGLLSCNVATNRSVRHDTTVRRAARGAQQARILTHGTDEAGPLTTADHNYSCFDSFSLRCLWKSVCAHRDRGYQPLASVGENGPRLRVTNAGLHERSPEGIGMRSGSVKSSSPENTDARPAQGQYSRTLC